MAAILFYKISSWLTTVLVYKAKPKLHVEPDTVVKREPDWGKTTL